MGGFRGTHRKHLVFCISNAHNRLSRICNPTERGDRHSAARKTFLYSLTALLFEYSSKETFVSIVLFMTKLNGNRKLVVLWFVVIAYGRMEV